MPSNFPTTYKVIDKNSVKKKRARLIVRNLPFSISEDHFRNHFSPYGLIEDVNILKRPDGKLIGCGFVQFERRQSAAKAIHYLNGKPLLGRPVIVDWAVSKSKFNDLKSNNTIEGVKVSKTIKEAEADPEDEVVSEIKQEENSDTHSDKNVEESTNSEIEFEVDDEDGIKQGDMGDPKDQKYKSRPRPTASHDVHERKTVFLRNVPFNCTNDELKEFMETIGPVYYAVSCIDPLTEHSRGTAFVKFKKQDDASKCIESVMELKFKNHTMEAMPALEKKNIMNQERDRHPDKKKNNRNLYLIKEGVVIAGTKAAEDLSMSDMKKRMELETWKSNMLRNLNMFVSSTRLIIHNLPMSYDDKMLKNLFKEHSPPNSRIIEAKVMRNLRKLDNKNKPISKGYGFITFTEHEHALAALRNVNNNPKIFNKNTRPIVAFSIENRVVHKIKQQRTEKSRVNNTLCPDSKKLKGVEKQEKNGEKLKRRVRSENVPSFAGIEAHPGSVKLPSRRKIALQGTVHLHNVKAAKQDRKRKRFTEETRKEKKREHMAKKPKVKNLEEKEFNQMVEKYKKKIVPNVSMKKWYESN